MLPSIGYTLARVAQILRGMRGAFDTMDTYGPSRQGRIVSFLKLYPNMFTIQGSGPGIRVLPAAAPARPVQVGGASSSSGPAERQPRALEIDPRAPYRRFPNDQRVCPKIDAKIIKRRLWPRGRQAPIATAFWVALRRV